MDKYIIDYLDSSGDMNHVWVDAPNKEDAELIVKREYWNIDTIVNIYKKK